jgi:hypothetical protein
MSARVPSALAKLAAGLLVFAPLAAAPAQAQPASSYQNSCSGIRAEGAVLVAHCRRMDGSYDWTRLPIRGVANIDGHLQFQGMRQVSSFQNSCSGIYVSGDVLSANCRRIDGSYRRSSIEIPGIANINGQLQYQ